MKLHVFNPEHDIALAANLSNFTAPHAGRQLRTDLGYLPALWADDGDVVLVDCVERADCLWRRLQHKTRSHHVEFVDKNQLRRLAIDAIEPWGWDVALCAQLRRWGIADSLLPTADYLKQLRVFSHRRQAAKLLSALRLYGTVGEAVECDSLDMVQSLLDEHGSLVLKAPWSSSGRGVRFVSDLNVHECNWLQNVIHRQGSVMAEIKYNKVKDFGMEFLADGKGNISYCGLSLFHTANGVYAGNLLATEAVKRMILSRYVSLDLLDAIRERIAENLHLEDYCGPFGIDMMAVRPQSCNEPISANSHCLIHPCVEINLRRTMGHAALAVAEDDDEARRIMRIDFDGTNYKLKIRRL